MPVVSPTSGFIEALRFGSTLVLAQFRVYTLGAPTGGWYTANVSTGNFTVDRNSEQRRSGELTIEVVPTVPPPALLPTSPSSLLAPFGNEVAVQCGITATGNVSAVQWVPLGLYAIATTTVDDTSADLTATLNLYDRSWTIAQRVLKQPWNFPAAGGNFVIEIQTLLNKVWSEQAGVAPLQYNIVPTSQTVPVASYDQGSDPWQAALDMAAAVGYELYMDVNGTVTGKPVPNPYTTAPCWNFTDDVTAILGYGGSGGSTSLFGSPYSTPIEVSVAMTRDGIYNDIIIQGTGDANAATYNGVGTETSGPPILAEAQDTNPQSPTYVAGSMGDVPNFVSSSLVTSAGAQGMAQSDLQASLSGAWTATPIPPNPIFDIDDVVTITRPRVGLNNAPVVLDTLTHTFNYADQAQLTGRVLVTS